MITLNGIVHRQFFFPADPLTTLIYFSELSRIAIHLPHITVVDTYTDNQVRIRYQTVELGAYTCLLYTSPSPRDGLLSRMPSSA